MEELFANPEALSVFTGAAVGFIVLFLNRLGIKDVNEEGARDTINAALTFGLPIIVELVSVYGFDRTEAFNVFNVFLSMVSAYATQLAAAGRNVGVVVKSNTPTKGR